MRLPRWMHRLYARAFGYFWAPCPSCGRYFGGHEAVMPGFWVTDVSSRPRRKIPCPDCTRLESVRDAVAAGHRFGTDIMRATGYPSGTVYPLLARLERDEVIDSDLEPDPGDRPARRRYRLAKVDGDG